MENSGGEIVELKQVHVLGLLGHELVAVLTLEVLLDQLESLLVHHVAHRLPDPQHHVQHQVPVVVADVDKGLVLLVAERLVDAIRFLNALVESLPASDAEECLDLSQRPQVAVVKVL